MRILEKRRGHFRGTHKGAKREAIRGTKLDEHKKLYTKRQPKNDPDLHELAPVWKDKP